MIISKEEKEALLKEVRAILKKARKAAKERMKEYMRKQNGG